MRPYGAESIADKRHKQTACLRDPQRQKRRALKKKHRRSVERHGTGES